MKEFAIISRASQVKLSSPDLDWFHNNVTCDLDWGNILYQSVHHRISGLLVNALKGSNTWDRCETHVRRALAAVVQNTKVQNMVLEEYLALISAALDKAGIQFALLKGPALVHLVYDDKSFRQYGDLDFLISRQQAEQVTQVMSELGFMQGTYDIVSGKMEPISRAEKVRRTIFTHELPEFVKADDRLLEKVVIVDFNTQLQWRGVKGPDPTSLASKLLEDAVEISVEGVGIKVANPEDFLLHLCMHLYSEAVYFHWHTNWVRDKNDLNLIKICDIRETAQVLAIDWGSVVRRLNCPEPEVSVAYSLLLVEEVFPGTFPREVLSACGTAFNKVDVFFDRTGVEQKWETPLVDRLFRPELKIAELKRRDLL